MGQRGFGAGMSLFCPNADAEYVLRRFSIKECSLFKRHFLGDGHRSTEVSTERLDRTAHERLAHPGG